MPLNFYTQNVACFPEKWFKSKFLYGLEYHLNGKYLDNNLPRAKTIIDKILHLSEKKDQAADIISFQEVFDPEIKKYFIKRLHDKYPYYISDESKKCCNVGSGLLTFSRYRILDSKFIPFSNAPYGEELFANKGFLIAELQLNKDKNIFVVKAHLSSGNTTFNYVLDALSKYVGGTWSERRDAQLQKIYEHLKPIKNDIFLMGDFNISFNTIDNFYPKTKSRLGRHNLFNLFLPNFPINFQSKNESKSEEIYSGSFIPEDILAKAKIDKKKVSSTVGNKLIDGIFKNNFSSETLKTEILQIENASDHRAIVGRYT